MHPAIVLHGLQAHAARCLWVIRPGQYLQLEAAIATAHGIPYLPSGIGCLQRAVVGQGGADAIAEYLQRIGRYPAADAALRLAERAACARGRPVGLAGGIARTGRYLGRIHGLDVVVIRRLRTPRGGLDAHELVAGQLATGLGPGLGGQRHGLRAQAGGKETVVGAVRVQVDGIAVAGMAVGAVDAGRAAVAADAGTCDQPVQIDLACGGTGGCQFAGRGRGVRHRGRRGLAGSQGQGQGGQTAGQAERGHGAFLGGRQSFHQKDLQVL